MKKQFSKEEAQQIFALAAERQQAARTREEEQLSLSELEEAGLAAGIDPAYIKAAAADLLRPGHTSIQRSFLGLPVELRRTRVFSGSLADEQWMRAIAAFREVFGRPGKMTELDPVREWASESDERKLPVRVTVEPDGEDTRVTIERKTWPRVLGISLGTGINLAMGLVLLITWLASGATGELWYSALFLTVFALLFGAFGSAGVRRQARRDEERFEDAFHHLSRVLPPRETVAEVAPFTSESTTPETSQRIDPVTLEPDASHTAGESPVPGRRMRTGE